MKTLSVRAPWWWWILNGKPIENRSQPTKHRGFILLHASKYWSTPVIIEDDKMAMCMSLRAQGIEEPAEAINYCKKVLGEPRERPIQIRSCRGFVVGVAEIIDCVTESDSPWFVGPYGWKLANVEALSAPYPATGMLGLFDAPASPEVVRIICRHHRDGLLSEGQAVKTLTGKNQYVDRVQIRTIVDDELGGMAA